MELGSTEAIKRAVSANLGISIVSPYSIQWELKRGQLVARKIKEAGFARQFNLIYHHRLKLSTVALKFLDALRS